MTKKVNVHGSDEPNWGLFYREHTKDLDARKSIKVKLPIRQHIKLHAMKLFTENNISETVERALDEYFAKMKEAEEGAQPPSTSPQELALGETGAAPPGAATAAPVAGATRLPTNESPAP